jgi:hypothetical protein
MSLPEETTAAARRRWTLLRLEYILLIAVVLLMTVFAFSFFYFQVEVSRLKDYGYAGVFVVNFIGAASMFLPTPAAASVVGGGRSSTPAWESTRSSWWSGGRGGRGPGRVRGLCRRLRRPPYHQQRPAYQWLSTGWAAAF